MTDELEWIWKEMAVALSGFYTGICLEGLRKTTKTVSEDTIVRALWN
jgi:hypothetical protein